MFPVNYQQGKLLFKRKGRSPRKKPVSNQPVGTSSNLFIGQSMISVHLGVFKEVITKEQISLADKLKIAEYI